MVDIDKCAKLSFSDIETYQKCVILSGVATGNAVEESSAYQLFATGKILRFAQDDTAWLKFIGTLNYRLSHQQCTTQTAPL